MPAILFLIGALLLAGLAGTVLYFHFRGGPPPEPVEFAEDIEPATTEIPAKHLPAVDAAIADYARRVRATRETPQEWPTNPGIPAVRPRNVRTARQLGIETGRVTPVVPVEPVEAADFDFFGDYSRPDDSSPYPMFEQDHGGRHAAADDVPAPRPSSADDLTTTFPAIPAQPVESYQPPASYPAPYYDGSPATTSHSPSDTASSYSSSDSSSSSGGSFGGGE
jgi:hypothetical protein